MKRIIFLLLALITAICLLASCANQESQSNEDGAAQNEQVTDNTQESTPEGFALYKNKDISFVYPSDWKKDGDNLANADGTLIVSVKSEDKTDFYEGLDTMKYVNAVRGQGMDISTARVGQRNIDGIEITDITQTFSETETEEAIYENVYAFSTKNKTYTITITQPNDANVDKDAGEKILNSLKVK